MPASWLTASMSQILSRLPDIVAISQARHLAVLLPRSRNPYSKIVVVIALSWRQNTSPPFKMSIAPHSEKPFEPANKQVVSGQESKSQ